MKTPQNNFEHSPDNGEGGSVGLVLIIAFYFLLGFILGAWLW